MISIAERTPSRSRRGRVIPEARLPGSGDLLLKVVRHVLAAVVMADAEAAGRVLLDATETLGDTLPDRLERLVAGAVQGGVDADALRRAVIDGDEHRDLAVLEGERGGHVGSSRYALGSEA